NVQLGPAMVTGDVAGASFIRQRQAHGEAGGNADGASHADRQRVKIGTVSALGIAGEKGVASTPAGTALVVFHQTHDLVVDSPGLFGIAVQATNRILGERSDWSVERDERLSLQVLSSVFSAQALFTPGILIARGVDSERDSDWRIRILHS